jgi:hypothetical protein
MVDTGELEDLGAQAAYDYEQSFDYRVWIEVKIENGSDEILDSRDGNEAWSRVYSLIEDAIYELYDSGLVEDPQSIMRRAFSDLTDHAYPTQVETYRWDCLRYLDLTGLPVREFEDRFWSVLEKRARKELREGFAAAAEEIEAADIDEDEDYD